MRKSLEKENKKLKNQEQELIANAKVKARDILLEAKEDANEIIKQMHSLSHHKDLQNARNKLTTKIKEIHLTDPVEDANHNDREDTLTAKDIKPNMQVFVTNLGQNGVILSHVSKSNEVQVQVGNLKMNMNIKFLKLLNEPKKSNFSLTSNKTESSHIAKTKTIHSEINVIGLNVEEAIFVVDKFLDDASLSNLQTVRIVHGKGTGKLRTRYSPLFKKSSSH